MELKNKSNNSCAELTKQGNKLMMSGDYLGALGAYSDALALRPDEYRLSVNRALCYMRLDYYYLALMDINKATKLADHYPKCYFIRSKILKKLNQVELVERDLMTAACLAPENMDIAEELNYFINNEKNELLLRDKLKGHDLYEREYYKVKLNIQLVQAHKVPTNLWGYHAIRVNNILNDVDTKLISIYFSFFGYIKNIRKNYRDVVIDYGNPVVPMFTIAYFQGKVIPGLSTPDIEKNIQDTGDSDDKESFEKDMKGLKLFFAPGEYQNDLKYARPKHPQLAHKECYYWRTTSCLFKDRCNKLHIPANKNVDTQVWMTH